MPEKPLFLSSPLGSSLIIWDWFRYDLDQAVKRVESKSQKVLGANSYILEVTGEKVVEVAFLPPILNRVNIVTYKHHYILILSSPRHWNPELVFSGVSLTSWGESVSLALVGYPSSVGVLIKTPYGVDVLLHRLFPHPILSCWVG